MALPILDGNQTSAILATTVSGGAHYPNHIIASSVTISSIPNISGTVTVGNSVAISSLPAISGTVTIGNTVTISGTVTANPTGTQTIAGTVTANVPNLLISEISVANGIQIFAYNEEYGQSFALRSSTSDIGALRVQPISLPAISGTVTANLGSAIPTGTNRIGVVTIGGGTVTIGSGTAQIGSVTASIQAGTAQIGSVTASISGTVPISISSVTVGNSVTIGSLPAISGTVTANVFGYSNNETSYQPIPVVPWDEGVSGGRAVVVKVQQIGVGEIPISGTVTIGSALPAGTNRIGVVTIGAGTVTIGAGTAQIGSVTISSLPAISGTVSGVVTAGALKVLVQEGSDQYLDLAGASFSGSTGAAAYVYCLNTTTGSALQVKGSVSLAAGTSQIGTVTVSALPTGALTTRFGSVTTANTAQITTAVTNTSRKYLLAQNISTGTVTIGIGFSPTTTQGIQLTAGAGLTFDSFVPTGAVYWLGATTGAAYTILEG
jgi:hypothetical protein